ncbi:RlpA-like double-psi beta-barrel-protein domain-containing protein-containing protein [Lineolata rhizophorae]|uniref:RlpA-like double-psi beta-barrel-protein domain-containing protein-containing protein n=1 Tax=Lineolata rhizophorae TaxID=578093 RepID=A0A6A6PC14_9PEZI|nr:RlpA-like double-psi beta-barrel-protein domain-containing protein-containing protein [Lineolata rhizophorae]
MKTFSLLSALPLLGSLTAAAPVNKRDMVWVTETAEVVETVAVTVTVWVNPTDNVPEATATPGQFVEGAPQAEYSPDGGPAVPTTTLTSPSSSESAAPLSPPPSFTPEAAPAPESTTLEVIAPASSSAPAPASQAPEPETSEAPAYAPPSTSSEEAPVSLSTAEPNISSSSGSSSSGETFTGDITYYTPGLGSCGFTNSEGDDIVALAAGMMTSVSTGNSNNNPYCGKKITIEYEGNTHTAEIVDTCPGCDGASLDLTQSLFEKVAPNGDGRVHGVNWWFNDA